MRKLKPNKKQILTLLVLSLILTIIGIYSSFIYLPKFNEIGNIEISNAIIFLISIFLLFLLLEIIFDFNNNKEVERLSREIEEVKNKLK